MIFSPIIVVGSGPSGTTFCMSAMKNNKNIKKILMLDQGYIKKNNKKNIEKISKKKIYHPKLINDEYHFVTKNYKSKNKIIEKNFFTIGSLALGGLSNVWGGGYWENKKTNNKDYNYFVKKYFEVYSSNSKDSYSLSNYLNKYKTNNNLKYKPAKLISFKGQSEVYNSKKMLEILNKLNNFTYKGNCYIESIIYKNGYYILIDDRKKKYKCKKLILACGTLSTTRLILKFTKIKNIKIKLLHNLSYGFLGILKNNIKYENLEKHNANSVFFFKDKKTKLKISGSVGRYNYEFANLIKLKYPLMGFFLNKFLNFFKNKIIIGNLFLPSKFVSSEVFLNEKNNLFIDGKINKRFKKQSNQILKNYFKSNLSFNKIFMQRFPLGSDAHYSSTLNNHSNVIGLRTNEQGQLENHKNLYIVDASILSNRPSLFPTFEVMRKAFYIGKFF